MWDNVDGYSSEGCLFCPWNVFPKNEWAMGVLKTIVWKWRKLKLTLSWTLLSSLSYLSPTYHQQHLYLHLYPQKSRWLVESHCLLPITNIIAEIIFILKTRAQYSNSPSRLPQIQILHWWLSFPRCLLQKWWSSSSWSSPLPLLHLPPAPSPCSGLQRSWTSPPAHHFHLPLL